MLIDVISGQVFGGVNMDECIELVLFIKLMMVYLVFEVVCDGKFKYDQMIMFIEIVCIVKIDELCMFLQVGKFVFVCELM